MHHSASLSFSTMVLALNDMMFIPKASLSSVCFWKVYVWYAAIKCSVSFYWLISDTVLRCLSELSCCQGGNQYKSGYVLYSSYCLVHDDVMIWKHFGIAFPALCWRNPPIYMDQSHKGMAMRSFGVSLVLARTNWRTKKYLQATQFWP